MFTELPWVDPTPPPMWVPWDPSTGHKDQREEDGDEGEDEREGLWIIRWDGGVAVQIRRAPLKGELV